MDIMRVDKRDAHLKQHFPKDSLAWRWDSRDQRTTVASAKCFHDGFELALGVGLVKNWRASGNSSRKFVASMI